MYDGKRDARCEMRDAASPVTSHSRIPTPSSSARAAGGRRVTAASPVASAPSGSGARRKIASRLARVARSSARRSALGAACVFSCGRTRRVSKLSARTAANIPIRVRRSPLGSAKSSATAYTLSAGAGGVAARPPQRGGATALGRGGRLAVRPPPPRLEALRPHRREHPDPRAALPARQREVLGNRVHAIGGVGAEHPFLAPRRELTRRPEVAILPRRRFREREVHDIVRVPRGKLRALFRRHHVVGGREQRAQARRRAEALAPERRRERRQVGVHHGGESPCPCAKPSSESISGSGNIRKATSLRSPTSPG